MKSSIEIMREVLDTEIGDQDDIRANTFHRTNLGEIQECILRAQKEVIEEMAQNIDRYIIYAQPHWTEVERLKNELK